MTLAPTSATGSPLRRRASTGGFTLLEMVMVIAIAVLIASSVPVALNRMLPARRLAVAAERLVTDVRWLQAHATASGHIAYLEVTSAGYILRIPGSGIERRVDVPEPIEVKLQSLRGTRPAAKLEIYPEGTTSGGFFDVGDSRRRHRVEVSTLTGKVRRVP